MPICPLTLIFALCIFARAFPARAQDQPAQPAPQEKSAPSPDAQNSGAAQKPGQPSSPDASPKPQEKPKKVITNEDIEGTGAALFPSNSGIDLNKINECDRACFEQMRQAARISPGANPQWKRTLLDGIEKVKSDGEWQARLGGIARVRGKYCDLEKERNIEMARRSGPGTVTPEEINLEELYARKFAALQRELVFAYERADASRAKYSGIVVQFMTLQEQRVSSAVCVQAPPVYYADPPGDDDDP
jgi:hypothetical protein